MDGIEVAGPIFIRGADLTRASARNARVGKVLDLDGSKIAENLDVDGINVASYLFMRDAELANVMLLNAHVGAALELDRSKVTGGLNMDAIQITSDLFMQDANFVQVTLKSARVGGEVSLSGSKFLGNVRLEALRVEQPLSMERSEFFGQVSLDFARLLNVDLAGGTFHEKVDLTGSQIVGELRLGSAKRASAKWSSGSTLILRNARVDAIQDLRDAWPSKLDLSGFTYRSLEGIDVAAADAAADADAMANRSTEWFKAWLGKQEQYGPDPYAQLASVLRGHGRQDAADEILFSSKEGERAGSALPRYVSLTASKWLIGYGYYLGWALFWVAGLLLAGIATLWLSGEGARNGMPYGIAYSFDILLPIIRLREEHYKIELAGWPRYYFYGHKIAGYVLASFLIAGIAGLTK